MSRKIAIASEHAGFSLKEALKLRLESAGFEVDDLGAFSDQPIDYPLIAAELAEKVVLGYYRKGILICGTGIGMSIAANKIIGTRAALCTDLFQAKMTRLHNDANVLCLGAWVTGERLAAEMAEVFLSTDFQGGRHIPRLEKIREIENGRALHGQ